MFGATSKVVAIVLTYPLQVVKTRIQDVRNAQSSLDTRVLEGSVDTVTKIFNHEGIGGFYKGLTPSLLRVVPASALTLATYEFCVASLVHTDGKGPGPLQA